MFQQVSSISDSTRKYDFTVLIDIADGNPNGNPDEDNRPRIDEETEQGLISDVCLKRKIRDYIDAAHADEPGRAIYVLNRGEFLEQVNTNIVKDCEQDAEFLKRYEKAKNDKGELLPRVISDYFCTRYFDVRAFGAVPGKPIDRSTIRGPIQMSFGRSIDPVHIQEHAISRVVQNKPRKEGTEDVHGTFGAKFTVRYGLYKFTGHYSPFLGKRTGFSDDDLALFWEALLRWPAIDVSAARSSMAVRGLYVFAHDDPFGSAPAHLLFSRVTVPAVCEARSWDDYKDGISIETADMPEGVTLTKVVG